VEGADLCCGFDERAHGELLSCGLRIGTPRPQSRNQK
jgi:hypothetical protein